MKRIIIREDFKEDCISRTAGEKLRHLVLEAYHNKQSICLDFSGVVIASTSFFDEGIAKLVLEGWDARQLREVVHFEGMNPHDQKVMKKVCEFRGIG